MDTISLELVMLVDDNVIDNFIAERVILLTGFSKRVLVTTSVIEALGYLKMNQYQPQNLPEIIFLDIDMPIHDGFYFLNEFILLPPSITLKCKVIILSCSGTGKVVFNHHVIKILEKPISESVLEEITSMPELI